MLVVKGSGLTHIIKKDRFSTRFFAAIFRLVAAVQFGNVPPYGLVAVPPSPPTLNEEHMTITDLWSMDEE